MKIITYSKARSSLKSVLAMPANAAHLATSIAQHKAGNATRRELVNPE